MLKRFFSLLICACLIACCSFSVISVNAEKISKGIITIDSVSGLTGDTIIVPIRISENPGIMAMTISITYNSEALKYNDYYFGDVISDYYLVDHPTKNLLRFVNCQKTDISANGTLLSIEFTIKDSAEADFHKINIEYSAGDFCNWDLDKIMPKIVSGGVDVAFNGNNCKHKKYGEYEEIVAPSCEKGGVKQRICKTCNHVDNKETDPIGHEYPDTWTIDEVATEKKDGTMSRHCIKCDHRVDIITFSYEHATEDDTIKNEPESNIPNNSYIEEIFKEQYPGQELTPNKPGSNSASNSNSSQSTSSKPDSSKPKDSATASQLVSSAVTSKPSSNSSENSESKTPDKEESQQTSDEKDNNSTDEKNEVASSDNTSDTADALTAIDKLEEVFPQSEKILNYFELAVILLLYLLF